MKKANITETKNNLSRLLEEVRSGTTILILDRNKPIAKLEPIGTDASSNNATAARLVRQGLVTAPAGSLDVDSFLKRRRVELPVGVSAVRTLLEERDDSR